MLLTIIFTILFVKGATEDPQMRYRIISGKRFKDMLVKRNTDCFRDWNANADSRCQFKETPNYRQLASQLVACEALYAGRNPMNCSDVPDWKKCYASYSDKDLDNYAAFYPEIAAYCANVQFESNSVTSATLSDFLGGVTNVRDKLDEAIKDYPLTKIALSQIIILQDSHNDFKMGQLAFYGIILACWILCKSFLKMGCEEYLTQVLLAGIAECCIAALYYTTAGLALV